MRKMRDICYQTHVQSKNMAWFLPRPKRDHYKGGMPLHCEEWLIALAKELLNKPDIKLLNLFCGVNKHGFRVDIKPDVNPDLVADAHHFSRHLKGEKFDVILADPPYSNEEAQKLYGTPKLNYKKWTQECEKLLAPGGLLIVFHKYLMPNPNPLKFKVVKRVFVGFKVFHLLRIALFFKKS